MEAPGIMDKFQLPVNVEEAGAREAVNKLMFRNIEQGVAVMSGHEKGMPYRFFTYAEFNGAQPQTPQQAKEWKEEGRVWSDSNIEKECVMPVYKDRDAVEFTWSKNRKPTMLVDHLGRERLRIGVTGEILGGTMAEDYKRWKDGLGPSGHPLELWHEMSPGILKTLNSQGVFTIEQFSSMPREKVKEAFPKNIQIIFEHLVEYVSGKDAAKVAKEYEARVEELEKELAELKEQGGGVPSSNHEVGDIVGLD